MSPAIAHPWPPGTRVEKVNSVDGDKQKDGARGRVESQLGHHTATNVWGYFVFWDEMPGVKVYITSPRLKPVSRDNDPADATQSAHG